MATLSSKQWECHSHGYLVLDNPGSYAVLEKFQIGLCPEIELVGEWDQAVLEKFDQMRTAA